MAVKAPNRNHIPKSLRVAEMLGCLTALGDSIERVRLRDYYGWKRCGEQGDDATLYDVQGKL